jgi:hypothetical protein
MEARGVFVMAAGLATVAEEMPKPARMWRTSFPSCTTLASHARRAVEADRRDQG